MPMTVPWTSAVYTGAVSHYRVSPFAHGFRYRVFSLYLDIDELNLLDRRLRLFSHNCWNLFTFRDRDHGPRDGSPLRPWIEQHLSDAGIDLAGGPVRLLCFPRVLGFVFNPLSIWFCFHAGGALRAVLYEVSNTFGDRHGYLAPVSLARTTGDPIGQSGPKRLYVSPFLGMDSYYDFRLKEPAETLAITIRQCGPTGPQLVARHTGRRHMLTDATLVRLLASRPLMTWKVACAIYWQALRLWLKGARPTPRPPAPKSEITLIAQHAAGRPADPEMTTVES